MSRPKDPEVQARIARAAKRAGLTPEEYRRREARKRLDAFAKAKRADKEWLARRREAERRRRLVAELEAQIGREYLALLEHADIVREHAQTARKEIARLNAKGGAE